ncbi:hypothetical protein J7T55_002125 [Diaporthe amygdali]|uniref:uncharacterized protein n=1 Tax=Phomopsis amygdali TaxID=1214568 RepID=UPI0022FECBE0|nr:uncharacterized protein J7T55_002125 [Diaporthe amygdali]KAJ0108521.1 hypothetical protein J7T55_002125 [Diaporthe amygdali]
MDHHHRTEALARKFQRHAFPSSSPSANAPQFLLESRWHVVELAGPERRQQKGSNKASDRRGGRLHTIRNRKALVAVRRTLRIAAAGTIPFSIPRRQNSVF